ncbi:MAG: amidase [Candidatus Promineifilaceae bacterium]
MADIEELTIKEMQERMASDELTARALCEAYLDRIERLDRQGQGRQGLIVNSVIELNPDALEMADKLDEERREGKVRGLLHGIPILIKDNIATRDQMQTTAGSLALEGSIVPRDAYIVKKLRKAGAVILGKTNLSEWANFRGRDSISGWSSRGGLTRNPYALDRSACGSSSGSGAAVAANFCAAAIGTETDGSIICPSQTNGIVGIKPTLGLLSRSGIVPIAHSQDTAGPMARTVADAAILLGALTGVDKRDPATQSHRKRKLKDYTPFLDKDGLKGARIGVARNLAGTNPRILALFENCLEVMKDQGAEIVDPADVPNYDRFGKGEGEVLHSEFKADLNAYLAELGETAQVQTMADVIRFNEENSDRVMPFFGQERFTTAQEKGSLKRKKYLKSLKKNRRLTREEGIDAVLKQQNLDALVSPSGGPAWTIDLVNGDASNWDMHSSSVPAVAGYPHLTVPAGYIFGLPVGLSFIASTWQEPTIIRLAYAFEQATLVRRPPEFLETAELGV